MGQLDGKVALITGAGSGIGKATAERFAAEGARVCAVDFDIDGGRTVAQAVEGHFVATDAGEAAEVDAAFAECEQELGGIDIAFLNAGIAIGHGDLATLPDELYRRIMRVNVDGVVYGLRAAIPALERRGGGAIVATASIAGLIPFPPDPIYDASKHAVVGLIRSAAPPLLEKGITANTVNPGMTDTNILSADAKRMFEAADFPLMAPSQIAEAVLGIVTSGRTGECWVCQPGRDPEPYRFHGVPGPCRGRERRPGATGSDRGGRRALGTLNRRPDGSGRPISGDPPSARDPYRGAVPDDAPADSAPSAPEAPVRPEVLDAAPVVATDGASPVAAAGEEPTEQVTRPTKLIRIASMVRTMLDEVRRAPLDEEGRRRLREIHERSLTELEGVLSPDLQQELSEVVLPLTADTPSESELRLAQAQLVGWLEGLFHGIQASIFTQQAAAQQQLEQMRQQRSLEIGGPGPERTGPGAYL